MSKEIISPDEARGIGLAFIQGKYYHGKITMGKPELVTKGAFPEYQLTGSIKMRTRGIVERIMYSPTQYTFTMQVHALEGRILNYEVT